MPSLCVGTARFRFFGTFAFPSKPLGSTRRHLSSIHHKHVPERQPNFASVLGEIQHELVNHRLQTFPATRKGGMVGTAAAAQVPVSTVEETRFLKPTTGPFPLHHPKAQD